MAIHSFRDEGTQDVFDGKDSKRARKVCPSELWAVAARKLDQVNTAARRADLRYPPGNRLEQLEGRRSDESSIRINDQYRVVFRWSDELGACDVGIEDYH